MAAGWQVLAGSAGHSTGKEKAATEASGRLPAGDEKSRNERRLVIMLGNQAESSGGFEQSEAACATSSEIVGSEIGGSEAAGGSAANDAAARSGTAHGESAREGIARSGRASGAKKAVRVVAGILVVLLLVVGGYVAYVFGSYHRLDDKLALEPQGSAEALAPAAGQKTLLTYNIGMGIYSQDYGFFMDGGSDSRANSEQAVLQNTQGVFGLIAEQKPDFVLLQEVGLSCTCNYGINQYEMALDEPAFAGFDSVLAENWDSPYLFYPIAQPFGKAHAGLAVFSRYNITDSLRRSLPIDESVMKIIDLDRCYDINRIPLDNGSDLVLIDLHLSAYAEDESVATNQIVMLLEDMEAECAKGNYVIAGGDFNKDLLGDSPERFGIPNTDFNWSRPFPFDLLPESMTIVAAYDESNPVPSARNADGPWDADTQFQTTIDGFIVSKNVQVDSVKVIDTQFANSDHNPVRMEFTLL